MACACLLGTLQILKPWNWVGNQCPHFLFHRHFPMVLVFYNSNLQNPAPKDVIKRTEYNFMLKV